VNARASNGIASFETRCRFASLRIIVWASETASKITTVLTTAFTTAAAHRCTPTERMDRQEFAQSPERRRNQREHVTTVDKQGAVPGCLFQGWRGTGCTYVRRTAALLHVHGTARLYLRIAQAVDAA
jgi:hypothetical protein